MLAGRLHNSLFELKLLSNVRANGTRLLVAVSGGLDSVVLLHLLAGLASKLQLELSVAHIDHGLRAASARDAEFVARLADQLGLPFLLATLGAKPRGENLEAWAREERYQALERLRRQSESQLIVTAHHRDDLVETLLFRAMSNRLTTSLATMEGYDAERKLLRPLLTIGRAELLAYAEMNGLQWVEDESNADLSRSRNLLRHQIVPQLQQESPESVDLCASLAREFNQLETELRLLSRQMVENALASGVVVCKFGMVVECPRELLESLPELLRLRVLNELLRRLPAPGPDRLLGRSALDSLNRLLTGSAPRLDLGHGYSAELRRQTVSFSATNFDFNRPEKIVLVESSNTLRSTGAVVRSWGAAGNVIGEFTVKLLATDSHSVIDDCDSEQKTHRVGQNSAVIRIPAESVCFPLVARIRHDGDVIRVLGRGTRKVKKLFQEQGLMLTVRDAIPIVEGGDRILWIPGVANSDLCVQGGSSPGLIEVTYRSVG